MAWGAVPPEILYDRMKTVWTGTDDRGEIIWNFVFLDFTAHDLVTDLGRAYRGSAGSALTDLRRTQGSHHLPDRLSAAGRSGRHIFFQLISARYERGSIILTWNKSCGEWGSVFGDPIIATAILDWLLHHSTTVKIRGESYRLKVRREADLISQPEQQQPQRPALPGARGKRGRS